MNNKQLETGEKIRKKRVIVIDDDEFTLDLVTKMLEEHYEILTAVNGIIGLKIIENEDIDLIVLDWMMPDMDGLSVLVHLKSNPELSSIPVVFLSGKAEPDSIKTALSSGAAAFVSKPFKKFDLIENIENSFLKS